MKTIDEIEESNQKKLNSRKKLRVKLHRFRAHSVTSYEISNSFGVLCGGNIAQFIPQNKLRKFDYPKVFFGPNEGLCFLANDPRAEIARNEIDIIMEQK